MPSTLYVIFLEAHRFFRVDDLALEKSDKNTQCILIVAAVNAQAPSLSQGYINRKLAENCIIEM